MKYSVGEQVIVSPKLHYNMRFGTNSSMEELRGKVVTITNARINGEGHEIYSIKEERGGSSSWSTEMLEPLTLDAEQAFEAYLSGTISEERYKEIRRERG